MQRGAHFLVVASLFVATEKTARADEVHELRTELAIDVAVTGTAIALTAGLELAKADLVPKKARWSDVNPPDETARDLVRWKDPEIAAQLSDATLIFFAPGTAVATLGVAASHDHALEKTPMDSLLVLEATAVNGLLNEIVKYTVSRERPYGHYPTALDPIPTAEARVSFYSGHTSTTSCLAAASGTIAHLRGYELAPLAWIPGAALAAFTGYLRIAADKHYFTDVVAGALVGTAMGIAIPLLFHPRAGTEAVAVPMPGTTSSAGAQMVSFGTPF